MNLSLEICQTQQGAQFDILEKMKEKKDQIGVIRFCFSIVKEMKRRTHKPRQKRPEQVKDYENGFLYDKGLHLATKPGKRIKVGCPSTDVAVLEEEVIYESRVYYIDIFGFNALSLSGTHGNFYIYNDPSSLRSFPLDAFLATKECRIKYLDRFITWIQQGRFNRLTGKQTNSKNDPVGTEDLLHFINVTGIHSLHGARVSRKFWREICSEAQSFERAARWNVFLKRKGSSWILHKIPW